MRYLFIIFLFYVSVDGQTIKQKYISDFKTSCTYKNSNNCKRVADKSADFLSPTGMDVAIKNGYAKQYFHDRENVGKDDWDNPIWPKSDDFRYISYRMFIDGELTRMQTLDIFNINQVVLPKKASHINLTKAIEAYFMDGTQSAPAEVKIFRERMMAQVIATLGDEYMRMIEGVSDLKEEEDVFTKKAKLDKREVRDFKELFSLRNQHVVQNIGMATVYNKAVDENISSEIVFVEFEKKYLQGLK